KLELKVGGEATPPKYDVPALASGATHTLRRHINLPNALRYLSIAKIDSDNGNVESDETNNEAELIFAVSPPPRPDLIIDSFINATENPTVTDDNVITVSVRNQGPASSTASKLELKVGGEAAPPKYDVPALASGATHTLRRHINLPNALRYLSIAKIDADNGNVESDETNNEAELIFAVSPPPRPDLIIDSFINATENPTVADDNVITVSVRNQGPASSTASKLELKVGGEAAPPKYDIPALASGATYTLRRHINLPNALRYLSIAKIDADNGNVESDETNNEEQLIFTVSPPLRIRGVRHK
ncbi:MAG: CARDB domain-containing protein, partial [Sedimenticola sp.]